MGWISLLNETYENNSSFAGKIDKDDTVLLPISHSTQNAQIEVTIDEYGEFLRAEKITDKENAVTIIPVTEDSGARGNGIFPHPLCDKLCYIAGDYSHFTNDKNKDEYYNKYLNQLESWCNSQYPHKKVIAILEYLKKGQLINDLVNEKILDLDDDGILSSKINKIQGINQTDCFVRFIVQNCIDNKDEGRVWLDNKLYDSFINYYESINVDKDICYITGKNVYCSDKHPSKIRHSGDKSKLISANDKDGFTFRGRFTESTQAASVGYETSQKAHNTLRWLIQKQGYKRDGAAIVAWAANGVKIPMPLENTEDTFFQEEIKKEADTAKSYADRLNRAIAGYKADLTTKTKIAIISVDAATTGRLSITYYKELNGSEFLERIKDWHLHCSWKHYYKNDEGGYYFVGVPSPREIALAAYGTEQKNKFQKIEFTANSKLIRNTVERLLPCIIDGRKIPYDIVHAAVLNASRPMAMSGYNWQRVLTNTCALIKYKYYKDKRNKEELGMTLSVENKDRSYLFGRLLAVADRVEFLTFEKGEKRETNAKRYMNIFSKRPAKTWEIIYKNILPYMNKLKPGQKIKYDTMISEIGAMLDLEGFNNDALTELYLLGYYSQSDFMKDKKTNNIIDEMEEEKNE
ncbi:MAG TPA: type I-C CRISPR-associated protein Cas8c/Csd1 [Clostridiales bacterium]|jgi:CRISPR-associated protein Csd1|nr:type I-C CRISPR-associated protein Cas8c/Csd1 [Clostridiales bacterium]